MQVYSPQEEYLVWWKKGCPLLGSSDYFNWWDCTSDSLLSETVTQHREVTDPWRTWTEEERRKERQGLSVFRGPCFIELDMCEVSLSDFY